MPKLNLKGVSLKIPSMEREIIHDISYEVFSEDFIVVLGGNGSGKSSLIKLINKVYQKTKGSIMFNHRHINKYGNSEYVNLVSTITQDINANIFPQLTVLENCLMFELKQQRVSLKCKVKKERKLFREYLNKYNPKLADKLDTECSKLSGGEKQSLILALNFLYPPELLLLDEHTSALDPLTGSKLMELTANKVRENNITCIMTTHNLEDALKYGNRIVALRDGKIIFTADYEEKAKLTREDLVSLCY